MINRGKLEINRKGENQGKLKRYDDKWRWQQVEKNGKSFYLKKYTFPPKPGFTEIYLECSVSSSEKRFGI